MKHSGKNILAFDIGTTSIKVGLFSVEGELLCMEYREQTLIFPKHGWVEQSLQRTWKLIVELVRSIGKKHPLKRVAAIALSTQRGSVIPLDKHGEPLSNQIAWMDTRGIPYIDWLHKNIGIEEYYNTSGHGLGHITGISKILWLLHSNPEQWNKTKMVAPPQTLFLKWLGCSELLCDLSCGTYTFPFDIDKKTWSPLLSKKMKYPIDKLPQLVSATEIVGKLSKEAAHEMGLTPGISLVAGGGDGQCAAVGCGVIKPGLCMINIGTGTGVQCYLPNPKRDPNHIISLGAHVVPEGWEMEAHTQASGAVFKWLRDEFGQAEKVKENVDGLNAFDLLVDQASLIAPGAEGLLLIPNFNGTTAPVVEMDARGMLMGLSLSHGRNHVIRAFLEGISLEVRLMLNAISNVGVPIDEIRMVGGGASNQNWNQIHADIFERPVTTLHSNEAALIGSAMCAAVALGEYKNLNEAAVNFVKIKGLHEPNPRNFSVYRAAFENYCEIFEISRQNGIFNRLKNQANLSHLLYTDD